MPAAARNDAADDPSQVTKDTMPLDVYAYEGSPFCKARAAPALEPPLTCARTSRLVSSPPAALHCGATADCPGSAVRARDPARAPQHGADRAPLSADSHHQQFHARLMCVLSRDHPVPTGLTRRMRRRPALLPQARGSPRRQEFQEKYGLFQARRQHPSAPTDGLLCR